MLETTKVSMAMGVALAKASKRFLQESTRSVWTACGDRARYILARFRQKFAKLSVPPNNVVKIVESTITMCPARWPCGGIQRHELNSVLPAAVNGCGRSRSTGCRVKTWIDASSAGGG